MKVSNEEREQFLDLIESLMSLVLDDYPPPAATLAEEMVLDGTLFEHTAAETKDMIIALGKEKAEPIVRPFIGGGRFNEWLSDVKSSDSHKPLIDLNQQLKKEILE